MSYLFSTITHIIAQRSTIESGLVSTKKSAEQKNGGSSWNAVDIALRLHPFYIRNFGIGRQ